MEKMFFVIIIITVLTPACMGADSDREGGLFSEGSFLSEAVSSATDKLSRVTLGEERIVDDDAKGVDKDILEYDRDPLGRSKAALTNDNYRNYRKRVIREREQIEGE